MAFFERFNMSNILMLGGDKRQVVAKKILTESGYKILYIAEKSEFKKINKNDFNVIILPVPSTKDGINIYSTKTNEPVILEDLFPLSGQHLLITGNYAPPYENYIDICKRDDYAILNAVPTAEAAIGIAIKSREKTLWKSKTLIVGNGKIGKALTTRLISFGADITVAARKSNDFALLEANNIKFINTNNLKNYINDFDIIFNTVPFPVLKEDELKKCKKECLLIELSSYPFGIDADFAKKLGLNFIYAPALPGKCTPITAGEILAQSLKNIFNENKIIPSTYNRSDI